MLFISYSRLAAVMVMGVVMTAGMGTGGILFASVIYIVDARERQAINDTSISSGQIAVLLAFLVLPQLFTVLLVRSIWHHWYDWHVFRVGPVGWLILVGVAYTLGMACPLLIQLIV